MIADGNEERNSTVFLLIVAIIGWVSIIIPHCIQVIKKQEVDVDFRSLELSNIKEMKIFFNERFNKGVEITLMGDDVLFFWEMIKSAERFYSNHPSTRYVGYIIITNIDSKSYTIDINYEYKKGYAFFSRKFGSLGDYKSKKLYNWIQKQDYEIF